MTNANVQELSRFEEDMVWESVYKQLGFNPSIYKENFPGFKEPSPSITFSFVGTTAEQDADFNTDDESHIRAIFKEATPKGELIFALDWQHTCYKFNPADCLEDWPISAFPDGDYHLFLSQTFAFGWLGHPWEKTICVFGEPLLKALKRHRPKIFRHPIRRSE